jgi:arylsulfatase A-like enzyme
MSEKSSTRESSKQTGGSQNIKWIALVVGLVVVAAFLLVLVWKSQAPIAQQAALRRDPSIIQQQGDWRQPYNKPGGVPRARRFRQILKKQFPWAFGKAPKVGKPDLGPIPKRPADTINVMLVVVDTQRVDSTSTFGAKHPTTPFLTKMASEGIKFTNAFSTAPWTVPAMYSLMTGLYPSEHGIYNGMAGKNSFNGTLSQQVLPEQAVTLAERLKEAGYTTFGVCTNHHLIPKYGFGQGFDHFVGNDFSFLPFPNVAVDSLADTVHHAPKFFMWLHYFDPHFPYVPQPPWFGQWNETNLWSYMDITKKMIHRVYREQMELGPDDPISVDHVQSVHNATKFISRAGPILSIGLEQYVKPGPNDDYTEFLKTAYMSEIRKTDEAMQDAFKTLKIDDNTLVIITADHGEEIFDHGNLGHRTGAMYQELLHIPLVIRLPGKQHAGKVIDTPVSLLDIMPTIFEVIGQPIPDGLSGSSLVPLIKGKESLDRPLYSELHGNKGMVKVIFEYPWKLILDAEKQTVELYNLKDDPGELNDMSTAETKRTKTMAEKLDKWSTTLKQRWQINESVPLDPEEIRKLQQMGYLQ